MYIYIYIYTHFAALPAKRRGARSDRHNARLDARNN